MLILSRKRDESIVVPDLEMTLKVLRITSNRVFLGINAPTSLRILREELLLSIDAQRLRDELDEELRS